MARKAQRPCRTINCGNLTRETYCEIHKRTDLENLQQKRKEYNREIRSPKLNQFYSSSEWQRARAVAIERDNHLCQRCLKAGTLKRAELVHHKVEVKDDWSQRLALDNLESLCHKCHNKHHKQAPPGGKSF